MKQICKRLSVVFLALVIVSGSVFTNSIIAQADTYKVVFSDDFDSYEKKTSGAANKNAMIAKGWDTNTNTKGNYNTGADYCVPANKALSMGVGNVSGCSAWTDYSVEATMTMVSDESSTGATYAGLSGRLSSGTHNTGYDLIVMKTAVTDTGIKLRLRSDGEKLAQVDVADVSNNTPFTLKLEFRGTQIYGYLNNRLLISYDTANDAVKHTQGWAGIRKINETSGMAIAYDNFVVSEIVNQDYPEGYLYYNNFDVDSSLADAGIYGNKTNTISGGNFNLGAGTYAYLRDVVDALYWEDYTVEADVQIVKTENDTATKGYAGIVARSTDGKNEGYEYRIYYNNGNTRLELAKRNGTTGDLGKQTIDFELNKYYKMTMTVHGNNIMCWFGDTLVFDVEDPDEVQYSTGYAGIRSTGQTSNLKAKVDNFSVREYQAPTVVYPEGYFYCNDFESAARLKNEGWSSNGTKEDGVYILDGSFYNYLTGVKDSDTWTDYVVEADVMINDDGTLPQYAGIVGRATGARKDGYELILVKESGTGNMVVRLYKRGVDSGKVNDKVNKVNVTWEPGKMNTLKMVLSGADIYCYFNGEIVFEITDNDNPYLSGYAGVISATGTAKSTYDNYVVREIQPGDFPADAVYPAGYLYYNDFSALRALNKEGWRSTGTKTNGTYVLEGGKFNYLTNVDGSKEWTEYVVEADVVLHDNGEYPQYTAIAARSTDLKNEGYELRLITEETGTCVRLYKRGIDSGKINDKVNKINVSVAPNEKHTLKMVVQGATITCYFDGVKMFEVTDNNEPYLAGYAGVHSATGTADSSFEYFAVRQIGDADIVKDAVIQKQDGDIWFFDDFLGEESMTERGWNTDKVAIRDGAALVSGRVVVDKIQDGDKWKDYEVSAIVYVDKEAGLLSETASSGGAAVVARSLSSTTGYEFGIISSPTAASYIRLFDRANGVNLAEDKTIPITSGEHTLRMVCIGNEIYCYLDETLVFAVQSNSATAGYAGVRASNYDTYYKDFTVRKARPVTTTIRPSGTVSPVTGDAGVNSAVIYGAALVLSLSMIGLVVTATYSRKRR